MARSRKKHVSLRIDEALVDGIDRWASQRGVSRNALAERYLAEGQKMDEFPQIYFRSGELGRRAALLGTRLDVWQVMDTVRSHDNSVEAAAAYLGLAPERVRAAVRYYAANREEVDEFEARAAAAAERAEELWRAEQELLAS
jgi:uncharacterized protein (DUF433 family)